MVTHHAVEVRHVGELCITDCGGRRSVGIPGVGEPVTIAPDGTILREWVAEDGHGRYRPLSGYRSLRRGWMVVCDDRLSVEEALDVVYPLARQHRAQLEAGTLRTVPLEETLGRQSGRYENAGQLSDRGRELAVDALCGGCVRTPTWHGEAPPAEGIPCPEACSVLVALCREAERWERGEDAASAPISDEVGFAAFDVPGNEIREALLRRLPRMEAC